MLSRQTAMLMLRYMRHTSSYRNICQKHVRQISNFSNEKSSTMKSHNSLYDMKTMLNESNLQEVRIKKTFENMSIPLLMQNIAIAISNNEAIMLPENRHLYGYIVKKLNSLIVNQIDYKEGSFLKPIGDDSLGMSLYDQLLHVCFQLSLNMGLVSVSESLLFGAIEKFKASSTKLSILDERNINLLVNMYTVRRAQSKNVKDLDNLLMIVKNYNKLMKLNGLEDEIFHYSDDQIKFIIEKTYGALKEEKTTETEAPFSTTINYDPPYSTIELLIRDLGEILTQRVSTSLSYYKTDINGNSQDKVFDLQEIRDRQLLSKYLQFCYYFIHDRCRNNDPTTVYIIWSIIKPFHNKIYNATINSETNNLSNNFYYYQTISSMIRLFSKNKRYRRVINEIVFDLPLDSVKVCPELMTSILYHCGRSNNQTLASLVGSRYNEDTVVKQGEDSFKLDIKKIFGQGGDLDILGTGEKFTPGQVRAFYSYALRVGDVKSALKVMSYYKYKMIDFSNIDFNELVRSILYSENHLLKAKTDADGIDLEKRGEVAWEMISANVQSFEYSLNKYALVTYLDFMVNTAFLLRRKLNLERVCEVYDQMSTHMARTDRKYWDHFNMTYMKYIIRKYPLDISRKIYKQCKTFTFMESGEWKRNRKNHKGVSLFYFQQPEDYGYHRNPFIIPFEEVRFRMREELQINILRDIYQRSTSYVNKAKHYESVDLEEAKEDFAKISQWVYDELREIHRNNHRVNEETTHKSLVIDLMRTVSKRSQKIGFTLQERGKPQDKTGKGMSESEKRYRVKVGEQIAIDGVSLEEDFQASAESFYDTWNGALRRRKGKASDSPSE